MPEGQSTGLLFLHGAGGAGRWLAFQERLAKAGVRVLESRISHLAYAPEIATVMLRRQQASAVIAARARIVELSEKYGLDVDPDARIEDDRDATTASRRDRDDITSLEHLQ